MKKWKRIFKFAIAGCLVLVLLLSNVGPYALESQASTVRKDVLDETFNSTKMSDEWLAEDATIATDYNAMRFNSAYYWSGAVVLNAYEKQDYNKFVMNVTLGEYTTDSWIGFGFGGETPTSTWELYDGYVLMNPSVVSVVDLKNIDKSTAANVQAAGGLFEKLAAGNATIEIEYAKTTKGNFNVTLKYIFADKTESQYTWSDIKITEDNPYFAINSSKALWDITDFKVLDQNGNVSFYEDFSKASLTYSTEDYANGNWHICTAYTEDDIYVGQIGKAKFAKKDSKIIYKTALNASVDSEFVYELSYLMDVEALKENSVFGMGFGMKSQESALDETAFLGITKLDEEKGAFVLVKDGEIVKTVSVFAMERLAEGDGNFEEVSVRINYDFSVSVTLGKLAAKFKNIRYDGYWGLGNVSLGGDDASVVYVDDVKMHAYDVVRYSAQDASNNFAGTKTEESDGMTISDYYIDESKWFMGSKVSQKLYIEGDTQNGILFNMSNAYSCFGYREKYDEYVVQFDVVVNGLTDSMMDESYTGAEFNGQAFGLAFNKSSFFANAENSAYVAVFYNGWDPNNIRTAIKGNKCTTEEGALEVELENTDLHLWKDDETKYNFMYIVRDRSVEIYFKEDSQPMSELGICRAKYVDVDTDGYATVFGTGNASFTLSNYRILNIGADAMKAGSSAFSLREDFSKEKISNKITLDGNAKVKNGALQLENQAGFYTSEQGTNYLMNFDVSDVKGNFEIDFSNGNVILFDKDNRSIGFVEGENTTFAELPKNRNFSKEGYATKVGVSLIGNKVTVGIVSEGESEDFIYEPIAEYNYTESFVKAAVILKCGEKLTVDNLNLYKLDHDYTAERIDYSPDNEIPDMWVVKDKVVGEKHKGSLWTIILVSAVVIVITATASAVVVVKKRKRGGK